MVEACAGLWERAIASATVTPNSAPLRAVGPDVLAIAGRMLAMRGEAAFAIDVAEGMPRLLPASTWTMTGGPEPSRWRYRLDLSGPSGVAMRAVAAAGVVHVRVNVDGRRPWRGVSPLDRAAKTGELAARIEAGMTDEAKIPTSRIVSLAGQRDQIERISNALKKGGIVATGVGQSHTEQVPASRFVPGRVGPAPDQVSEALRTQAGRDLAGAFGVPPALLNASGDGAGQREAWRRFWIATVAPIGRVMETELRAKLDGNATVAFEALRASDEDGRSRAVSRRAAAFKTFIDAGVERAEAMRLAGLEGME